MADFKMDNKHRKRIPFLFPNSRFYSGNEYMHTILLSKDLQVLQREVGVLLDRQLLLVDQENKIERKIIHVKLDPARTSTDLFYIRFVILLCICDDEDAVIGITGNSPGLGREWFVILQARKAMAMFSRQTTLAGTPARSISEAAYHSYEQVVVHTAMCFVARCNYRRTFETDYTIKEREKEKEVDAWTELQRLGQEPDY